MNLQTTDIIIRKVNGTASTWIAQRLLMKVCGVSDKYLWKKARPSYSKSVRACDRAKAGDFMPDSGKSWRWAHVGGEFYYALDRIPNRAPVYYRSQFGDEQALLDLYKKTCNRQEQTSLERLFKDHLKEVYQNYLEFYRAEAPTKRVALAKACGVLDFLMDFKEDYPGTENKIFKDLSPILKDMGLQYIPHNPLRLKEKFEAITEQNPIASLIYLPRKDNKNAEIYTDKEIMSWVYQLRSMPQNYSNDFIVRKITDICEMVGKNVPSRTWFRTTILEKPMTQFLTGIKRYGADSRKAHIHKSYLPKKHAIFAGDAWEMDATRVNMIAHQVKDPKTGKTVERNVFVIAVRDVYSGDVLGYSFDYAENGVAYWEAMKMAVQNTGYLPYEWITDRFPGYNTPEMQELFKRMESLGVHFEFTHNADGKPNIERFWRTIQSVFYMESDYFYGEGIQSRAAYAFRTSEYLTRIKKQARKEGWDFQANVEEASLHLEKYRNTPYSKYSRVHQKLHQSPAQLHELSEKPNVEFVEARQISMLFDLKKQFTLRHNGQFTLEFTGVKITWMIDEKDFNVIGNYFNQKVTVTYDLDNLETVHLWQKDGNLLKYLCDAKHFETPQMYGPNKEWEKLTSAQRRAKAIEQRKEEALQEQIGEEYALMGTRTIKDKANAFEDQYLNNLDEEAPMKKASNSDISEEALNRALTKGYLDQM